MTAVATPAPAIAPIPAPKVSQLLCSSLAEQPATMHTAAAPIRYRPSFLITIILPSQPLDEQRSSDASPGQLELTGDFPQITERLSHKMRAATSPIGTVSWLGETVEATSIRRLSRPDE